MTGELVGRTLGDRFRFEALLGEGTFAQVYRVFDLRRRATLAAKVLRQDVTRDHTFFKRFQREAAILARLQHPHIVRTYGIVELDGQVFILMDYIPGRTLQAVLVETKPLLPRAALVYLAPLVAALHFAHGEGIIHRDLKPANVLIHDNGTLYITDFGIARILSDTSTLTMGMAIGTPLYMAPEQIMGQPVTAATDVYALGVMAYEMLAGQVPFRGVSTGTRGNSTSERIAFEHVHVLPEPPLHLNPRLTVAIQDALLRALDKQPDRRFRSVTALYDALASAVGRLEAPADLTDPAVEVDLRLPEWSQYMAPLPERTEGARPAKPPAPAPQLTQPHLAPPPDSGPLRQQPAPFFPPAYAAPAPRPPVVSRPRRRRANPVVMGFVIAALLVLAGACAVSWYLLNGSGDDPPRQPYTDVPGTSPATAIAGGDLSEPTVPTEPDDDSAPGLPADLLAASNSNRIVFDSQRGGNLNIYVMNLDGSDLRAVTNEPGNERGPSWSPDGRQIAFYGAGPGESNYDIFVVNLDGTGLRNLTQSPDSDDRYPTWSPDGRQIAFHSNAGGNFDLYAIDLATGEARALTSHTAQDLGPDWSPDGRYIAFHTDRWGSPYQIAVLDVETLEVRQLTSSQNVSSFPTWSPDGGQIAYNTITDQAVNLVVMAADGSNARRITSSNERDAFPDWSPDGAYLIYQHGPESTSSIRAIPVTGGDPIPLTGADANFLPEWEPGQG